MKQIASLILFFFFLAIYGQAQDDPKIIDQCVSLAGDDATYLKDFVVKLPAAGDKSHPPASKNSILLRKNTTYRFTICNNENSDGEAIIQLYDADKMLASNFNPTSEKIYQSFNFKCSKTGPYILMISFKDGKRGDAVGIMSYVRRK